MGYNGLYVLPGGVLDGTEIPKKDNPLFGYPGSPTYRPGQPLSMGGILGKSVAEFNVEGKGVFDVPAQHLNVFGSALLEKREWNETTQTIVENTSKDPIATYEFVLRFTEAEWDSLIAIRKTGTGPQVKRVEGFLDRLSRLKEVDLDSSNLITFMGQLEARSVIAIGRAAEILA